MGRQNTDLPEALTVHLWGAFQVIDAQGADVTPHLAKSQALLALLISARNGTLMRSTAQSLLWSDRSKSQASGSLRQALAAVRKLFGDAASCISSDRQRIQIDLDRITIVARGGHEVFLDGLDIADEAFEDWLRQERSQRENEQVSADNTRRSAATQRPDRPAITRPRGMPQVVLNAGGTSEFELQSVEVFLVDSVARSLRENFSVPTFIGPVKDITDDTLNLEIIVQRADTNRLFLAARCLGQSGSELMWSGHHVVVLSGALPFEDLDLLSWINEIVAAIAEFIRLSATHHEDALSATHLGLSALRELFSMERPRVEEADRLLKQAYDQDPRAIFCAWRAQLRGIQWVERHDSDGKALKEQGLELAHMALSMDPGNSSVLATVANARQILDGDMFACETLSNLAVKANPANPLAWWSRALSHSYSGRSKEALAASEKGHALAKGSPYMFWWDMQVAVSACAARQMDRAILASERAAIFAPNFKPPMRVLTGLHAAHGSQDRAVFWGSKLANLEPDFTPDRLIGDPDYPSSLLGRYALVDPSDLRAITERVSDRET